MGCRQELYILLGFLFVVCLAVPKPDSPKKERVFDRDLSDEKHYGVNAQHNTDYDHEAFLGEEEAKTFDQLTPEESKDRLSKIVDKIDKDKDGFVTMEELQDWIQYTQKKYIIDDVERQWKSHNPDKKDQLAWEDYKKITYSFVEESGSDDDDNDIKTYREMMVRDKRRWQTADKNGDNELSKEEFTDFLHPEEVPHMQNIVIVETLEDIDKDKDGKIAFLQKAIDALELASNQQLSVKPSKIVAGHEPQKTNEFLQALGNAVKNKLDSKEAVSKVLSERAPKRVNRDRKASLDKKPVPSQRATDKSSRSTNKLVDSSKKISSSSSNQVKSRDDKERSHTKSKDSKLKEREKSKDRTTRKRDDSKVREKGSTKDIQKKPPKEKEKQEPDKEGGLSPVKNVHDNRMDDNTVEKTKEIVSPEKNIESPSALLNGDVQKKEQNEEPAVELKPEPELPKEVVVEKEEKPLKKEKTRRPPSAHAPRTPSARPVRAFPGTSSTTTSNKEGPLLKTDTPPVRPFTPSRPPSARPPSARPAPPKIRIRHIVENEEARPPSAKPVENVILDNKPPSGDEDDADFVVTEEKPKDEVASEMVVPSVPVAETPEEEQGQVSNARCSTQEGAGLIRERTRAATSFHSDREQNS